MADGNSTGPANTGASRAIPTVIQPGSFETVLSDDAVNLQLMNNHVIQRFVEEYADAVAPPQRIIDNITRGVQDDIEFLQSSSPEQVNFTANRQNNLRADRHDAETVRRLNNAREEIAQAETAMEEGVFAELQRVNDAFFEISTKLLNPTNTTATAIRAQIAEVDAQVATLESELAALRQVKNQNGDNPTFTPDNLTRIEGLIQDLDGTGVAPPQTFIDGGPGGPEYDSWREYYAGQVFFNNQQRGLRAVDNKIEELTNRMDDLADQYPEPYKNYQKLLGGNSLSEQRTDWWAIARNAAWIIAEEAAWIAAGVIIAPITGGIGTALLASARMAKRAGAIGKLVAAGIGGTVRLATWFARLEARVQEGAFRIFRRAWDRVRGRQPVRRGPDAGNGNGDGPTPRTTRCQGVVCPAGLR